MASAVIETGGKQYRVEPGQLVVVEKLAAAVGTTVHFPILMLNLDGKTQFGQPHLTETVSAEVVEQGKAEKVHIFTYKAKKRQRRHIGHRQTQSTVKIISIGAPVVEKAAAKSRAAKATPAA